MSDAIVNLEREIRSTRNRVVNGLAWCSRTSTGLRADLHRLEGLVTAHRIVTGQAPANPSVGVNNYSRETFDIDIYALHDLVKAS